MAKLLFLFEENTATARILRDMFTNISEEKITSNFVCISDVKPEDIDSHDVIVFIRPTDIYSWKIAKKAQRAGHITATFCDDDLLNPIKESSAMIPWRQRGLKNALKNSDIIWSWNHHLLNKYVHLTGGKRTVYCDTIVRSNELENIDISHEDNKKVKIVFAATVGHEASFERYIKPIVPDLVSEFGDSISFTFVGVHPNMDGYECEYIGTMPLPEYKSYMKKNHFDIGLAPIPSDEFAKCKYHIKFIDYTVYGTIGIYSNTEPYTFVVKNGENGLLADNCPEDWLKAIKIAINDIMLRESCVENAAEYLRTNHSENAVLEQIKCHIPEIFEEGKRYSNCGGFRLQKMVYYISMPLLWLSLIFYYLSTKGLADVINRAKRKITGRNAYSRRRAK